MRKLNAMLTPLASADPFGCARTIFEYLLSPVMKAFQEAGRER